MLLYRKKKAKPLNNLTENKKSQAGFGMLEAILASAIVGIGFAAVFTIVAYTEKSIRKSVHKQKLQLLANQIASVMEIDDDNIADYSGMDLSSCGSTAAGGELYQIKQFEWCHRLDKEAGPVATGDERMITVNQDTGISLIQIRLSMNGGDISVVVNKSILNI